jgi:hypothetical protein
MKKKRSKRKLRDSESDESSSSSEESEKERKLHKLKKRMKKDKDKKRERHYKNVAVKKEPCSSSDSEVPNRTLEKVLGRSIDFAGRNSAAVFAEKQRHRSSSSVSSSDRDCRRSAGVKVERNDARHKPCKDEARKREERSMNGIKIGEQRIKDSGEKHKRKSSSEGNDRFHRKERRQ